MKRQLQSVIAMGLVSVGLGIGPVEGRTLKGTMEGFQEVPAIFSAGQGKCRVKPGDGQLTVALEYGGLQGNVTQAHVHFGQAGVNGGIMIFICTNLGNGPADTPACPVSGTVTRTIGPADVIGGAAAQGIAAGDFAAVVGALGKKATYCNVHTDLRPGGEIRSQLK